MPIEIRKAQARSELEAVFRLRYEVYVEELGRVQCHVDHEARTIEEPLDRSGHLFCAFDRGRVVGTVRTNYACESDLSYYSALYDMPSAGADHPRATSISTKLLVAPAYRNTTLGYRLAAAGYCANVLAGMKHDFVDVYPARVPFFTRLGYVMHRPEVVHPEYGAVAVMRLGMRDDAHLRAVQSPFLRYLRQCLAAAA